MANTTTSEITAAFNNHVSGMLLSRAYPYFVHVLWAQVKPLPRNNSSTIKFRKYTSFSAATTALTEGVTPDSTALAITDITTSVSQYGAYCVITDFVEYTTVEDLAAEKSKILGDQLRDTIDQLVRNTITAGDTVQYASTATTRATVLAGMILNGDEIREAVNTLQTNNAKPFTEVVNPSQGFNTTPIDSAYIGICSPNTLRDLKKDPDWIPVAQYADSGAKLGAFEKGSLDDVRFVVTSNARTFSSTVTVHATMIIGQEAYGITQITGEEMEVITKPLGSGGTSDPLNQRSTLGWKISFATTRLQENFMVRIEHAVNS